ncbi:UDP-D-apiose/UDP-D-xylose synthase [Ananas comosus]|uniref:UDP-D-apiose/UDP-D-xylose synthase n=1 Tax=Ananas comosus TaxID=4615 RepID=A0A199VZA3_ANACO|nr:UDP-D-apiose/UDP-D-xylose synthase [Ananas comosus]
MVDGDNGGPSYCCGNRGPDYGEDGASCGVKLRHQFARVLVKHFRKTMRANQRCVEEEFSAVLFGVWVASVDDSLPREDAVTHLTSFVSRLLVLAVDTYSHKIKNLLEPHPEHGRIQFHRLNIKNGSQPEGLIKMTDLIRFSPLSPDVYRAPPRLTAGARPDPVPPTQHQERFLTRGPHQDVGSDNQPGGHLSPAVYNFHPPYTAICLMPFRWLSIGLKTASGSFTSPLMRCWEDYWKLSPKGSLSATETEENMTKKEENVKKSS